MHIKKEFVSTLNRKAKTVEDLIEFGVIVLDKPPGPTSHQVTDYVKRILKINKAGHGGSLDPNVTGVLPVALERASRLSQLMLLGVKEYIAVMHLHTEIGEKEIWKAMDAFKGKITQIPPIRSAVKRQARQRTIYSIEVLEIDGKDVLMRVSCQAGTYIRKLCHDIGLFLGIGAHMADLRRTKAGGIPEEVGVSLQDLKDAYVLWKEEGNEKLIRYCIKPAEYMVENIPKVYVMDSAIESISHGRDVANPGICRLDDFEAGSMVAIMAMNDELIALGNTFISSKDILRLEKGLAISTNKVFKHV